MTKPEKLFEPIKIGKLQLKNRIVMPALNSKLGTEFGAVSDRLIDFYVERARGGVSLIVIENTCIDWPVGKAGTNPIRADEWKFVQGLHDLAEAVRKSALGPGTRGWCPIPLRTWRAYNRISDQRWRGDQLCIEGEAGRPRTAENDPVGGYVRRGAGPEP